MISEIIIAAQKRNHGASVEDEPNKLRVIGRSRDYTPGIVAHHNEIRQRRRFVNLVFLEETEIRRGKIWQRKKNMQ